MSLPEVGFIGIGVMGTPMARNIAKAGYPLTVCDLDQDKTAALVEETGCQAVQSVVDLLDCEFIVTMLPNGHIVSEALTGPRAQPWLDRVKAGTIVIDMSSSEPVGTQELGKTLAAYGVSLVDAPVSGAKVRAADGSLTIMVGADDWEAAEKAKPLLKSMGNRLFDCGGLGCGHAVKALNNYVAATAYAATAEACLVAKRFGLDLDTLIDVLNVSTGKSFISEVVMKQHVVKEEYATGFAMGLLTKDVRIAEGLAREVGLDAPVSRLVKERWEAANDALGESSDHSEAIKSWDKDL